VKETTVQLVDRSRPTVSHGRVISPFRTLTTLVWLPAAPGRWPLVVFGHGFHVGPETYGSLLETWAAHGYVVAGPEFPLTDPAVACSNLDENDINDQPTDLRFATDALVAPASPVAAQIDPARVALAGHSDGGESALAASLAPAAAGEPRYRAVIAMSVQPLPGSGAMANPPILVSQGDADTVNPMALGQQTWQQAAPPKYFLVIHGGGHLSPLQAGSAWLPGFEAASEAFLDAYLAGNGAASGVAAAISNVPLLSLRSG
jgi:pimeloyl-ACP methyl ester carboxylesterase